MTNVVTGDYEDLAPRTWSSLKRPIVTREEWGAKPPRETAELKFPVGNVLFTQTKTEECYSKDDCARIIQQLQDKHTGQGLTDIQYNFIVGNDMNVYEGRGWSARPDKNEKYPKLFKKSIEIAYIGTFEDKEPLEKVMRTAWDVLEDGVLNDQLTLRFKVTEDYYQPASPVEHLERMYVRKQPEN